MKFSSILMIGSSLALSATSAFALGKPAASNATPPFLPEPEYARLRQVLEDYHPNFEGLNVPAQASECVIEQSKEILAEVYTQFAEHGLELADLDAPTLTISRSPKGELLANRSVKQGSFVGGSIAFHLAYRGYAVSKWGRRQLVNISIPVGVNSRIEENFTLVKKGEALRKENDAYYASFWMPAVSAFEFKLPKGMRTATSMLLDVDVYHSQHSCSGKSVTRQSTTSDYDKCMDDNSCFPDV